MQCTRRARAAWWTGVVLTLVLIAPAAPAAAQAGEQQLLIPSAGWQGRPIQDPVRDPVRRVVTDRAPRGWEAGPAALGTGTHRATGSQRVRELQWRLRALGYRPGPIDGIYGVRTRAAVAWFQVKHGFPVDGRASFAVVRHLRDRTTPDRPAQPERRADNPAESAPAAEPEPQQQQQQRIAPVVVTATEEGFPPWAVAGLLLLAFALGFAVVRFRRAPAAPRGIGYVRVHGGRRIDEHASTFEARCADHGIVLAGLITDDAQDERQPGLAFAFEQLEQGAADCLVVGQVGHLTRSPAELPTLLDTMPETPLVVLNADPAPPGSGRWARGTPIGGRSRG